MEYFDEDEKLKSVVESVFPMITVYKGQVYGVMLVKTNVELTMTQKDLLKEYFSGQYSDGWGESFEQQEIKTHIGTIYVCFWQSDNFFIKEESEIFDVEELNLNI